MEPECESIDFIGKIQASKLNFNNHSFRSRVTNLGASAEVFQNWRQDYQSCEACAAIPFQTRGWSSFIKTVAMLFVCSRGRRPRSEHSYPNPGVSDQICPVCGRFQFKNWFVGGEHR